MPPNQLQFLIYNTPQENVKINVAVKDETIWLTQKAMAALFDVQIPAISVINKHFSNIFAECSIDYNQNSHITHDFCAMVQNKFH
jgi:hypothetical protein